MATSAKDMLRRIDAALAAATGRVLGLNRLITAIVALLVSATVLCSLITGIADHKAGVQIPFGPRLTISTPADSKDTEQRQELLDPTAPPQTILGTPPLGMQKGMCFSGEFGMIEIYPPGSKARINGRPHGYP